MTFQPKFDHNGISKYLETINYGDRVIETDGCFAGRGGIVVGRNDPYNPNELCKCVVWDRLDGERSQMTTAITGGTRLPGDTKLNFEIKYEEDYETCND